DFGFVLNSPSTLTFPASDETAAKGYVWKQGLVAISSPYVCFTKDVTRIGPFKIGVGGGFNYALYIPGGNVWLSIQPRLGYSAYFEIMRPLPGQNLWLRAGYISYSGKASGINDVTSAGYFVCLGLAYQL
ncbi:MAG: hypothetical protein ACPL4K_04510, partial [Candidatus Margulisiibacteriota bacterium]